MFLEAAFIFHLRTEDQILDKTKENFEKKRNSTWKKKTSNVFYNLKNIMRSRAI
jgi:hypothetical protein